MKQARWLIAGTALLLAACSGRSASEAPTAGTSTHAADAHIEWGLVVHGGAGTIERSSMTPERERLYRGGMERALRAGHAELARGGSALDAVVAAVTVLEDDTLFNAGRGAVFTAEGTNSLDASIMDGATLQAGAVAGVMRVRNPITLARAVMEHSPHVMLSGAGAEEFAALQNITLVDPSYFYVEARWRSLESVREEERRERGDTTSALRNEEKFGTVGVVALDRNGNLAAGTSTGGMTNKRWGRIGDAPIIGAGTYANARCGISATGWGEYFIRNVVAYDICARMQYLHVGLAEAAHGMIMEQLEAQEPETGGIIGLDADGNVVATFNSSGMYHGWIDQNGTIRTGIYRDE